MTDINFNINNFCFNYRIGIVIRFENKILIQKDTRVNHITLPGGRCQINEDSINAALREIKEETGIDCIHKNSIGIIENFFNSEFNNKNYHEILIIHELKFKNKDLYYQDINNIEDNKKEYIKYEWIDINELNNYTFEPKIVLNMLNKKEFQHYINKDSE